LSPSPSLIDVHAHLCDASFDEDRDDVLKRARERGIRSVIAVGETLADAERNLALADAYSGAVWPSAGLYPTHLSMDQADELIAFIRLHRERLAAIGEVGLDHWVVKEDSDQSLQKEIFGRFIELGIELDLPLNVHSRSAGRRAVEHLIERGARRVLMHAFDGRASAAQPGVEAGFFFSVPPSIVRSKQKQKLVRHLPLECILLETDSPVLGPNPGERNEPANLTVSLEAVARIKGVNEETVVEAVVRNQRLLFGDLHGRSSG
jgi:TatD DNase family protein